MLPPEVWTLVLHQLPGCEGWQLRSLCQLFYIYYPRKHCRAKATALHYYLVRRRMDDVQKMVQWGWGAAGYSFPLTWLGMQESLVDAIKRDDVTLARWLLESVDKMARLNVSNYYFLLWCLNNDRRGVLINVDMVLLLIKHFPYRRVKLRRFILDSVAWRDRQREVAVRLCHALKITHHEVWVDRSAANVRHWLCPLLCNKYNP